MEEPSSSPSNIQLTPLQARVLEVYRQAQAQGETLGRTTIAEAGNLSIHSVRGAMTRLRALGLLPKRPPGDARRAALAKLAPPASATPQIETSTDPLSPSATLLDLLKNSPEPRGLLFLAEELNWSPRQVRAEVARLQQAGEQIEENQEVAGVYSWREREVSVEILGELPAKLLAHLQKKKDQVLSTAQVGDAFDVAPKHIRQAAEQLAEAGYNIYCDEGHIGLTRQGEAAPSHTIIECDGRLRMGIVSDTHLGSKYERLDVLDSLYDWFAQEGIVYVYHGGNAIDGCTQYNIRDRHKHGLDEQINYFLEKYPQRLGIVTHFIDADDHESSFAKEVGISVGRYLERQARAVGRNDLVYLGFLEHDIEVKAANGSGSFVMRVAHPGGGSAYATSYAPQKIVESLSGGEKPSLLFLAHYHKLEYLITRGVHVIQMGCTVDQSPWARKKRLAYHLGGWIIEAVQCQKTGALLGCKLEVRTFFDRGFYQKWEN